MDATPDAPRSLAALLAPLTDHERTRPSQPRWGLANMRRLLARPGAPRPAAPLVQIAGSKGKGTTAAYLAALAGARGLRTGEYTSPHVSTVRERILLDRRPVGEAELAAALRPILAFAEAADIPLTYFEALTAAAVSCFAAHRIDLGVLEVGLGGRLDATTAVAVQASIVTGIELEHTQLLGDTVEQIAAEKAWVQRPGGVSFLAAEPPALAVLTGHAERVGCEPRVLGRDFGFRVLDDETDPAATRLSLWTEPPETPRTSGPGRRAPDRPRRKIEILLVGAPRYERAALALAWASLCHVRPDLAWDAALELGRPALPGRFEVLEQPDGFPVVLDGAHTERSAVLLDGELTRRFPALPRAVLFASTPGKRWREALRRMAPRADELLVTGLSDAESEDPEAIAVWLVEHGARARAVPDAAAGLGELRAFHGVRVVTGSFYLVGEVRRLIAGPSS